VDNGSEQGPVASSCGHGNEYASGQSLTTGTTDKFLRTTQYHGSRLNKGYEVTMKYSTSIRKLIRTKMKYYNTPDIKFMIRITSPTFFCNSLKIENFQCKWYPCRYILFSMYFLKKEMNASKQFHLTAIGFLSLCIMFPFLCRNTTFKIRHIITSNWKPHTSFRYVVKIL